VTKYSQNTKFIASFFQAPNTLQESWSIAKMTTRCTLQCVGLYGCPENFRESLHGYAHGYFSRNCYWAFVAIDHMKVCTKFEVCSFTRSWDNRGTLKLWVLSGYAHAARSLFCKIFNGPCECIGRIWSRPVPEIIASEVLGGVANHQFWKVKAVGGRGWHHSQEHWWVPIGPPL